MRASNRDRDRYRDLYQDRAGEERRALESRLGELGRSLATLLEKLHSGLVSGEAFEAVRRAFRELEESLSHHFALEEQEGYFSEALSEAPRLNRQAARLYREHESFLRRAAQLRSAADEASAAMGDWIDLEETLRALTADLLVHEQREAELFHEALQLDLGGEPG